MIMATLNKNIRDLRVDHGLSQVELAGIMNVSKQCVSNWENDTISVSGLSPEEKAHICMLINDICKK